MQDLDTDVQKPRGERRRRHQGDTCAMQDLSTEVQKQCGERRRRHRGDT